MQQTGRVYEVVPVPGWSRKDWGWLIGWAGDDHLVLRRPFPPGERRLVDHELVVVDLSGRVVQEVEPLHRWDDLYVTSSDGLAPAGAPYTFGAP